MSKRRHDLQCMAAGTYRSRARQCWTLCLLRLVRSTHCISLATTYSRLIIRLRELFFRLALVAARESKNCHPDGYISVSNVCDTIEGILLDQ
jgi:hypothetical protein